MTQQAILGWTLGDWSLQGACDLRASIPRAYRGRTMRSDHWDTYAAFPKRAHRSCGKHEGETCYVERWFGTLRVRL